MFSPGDSEPIEIENDYNGEDYNDYDDGHQIAEKKDCDVLFASSNNYEVLDTDKFAAMLKSSIKFVEDEFGLNESKSLQILQDKNWNMKAIKKYLQDNSQFDMMDIKTETRTEIDCPICYATCLVKDMPRLNCGDYFCKDCIKTYLTEAVNGGKSCAATKCPRSDCPELIFDAAFKEFLTPFMFKKYETFKTRYIIDQSQIFLDCPGKECRNIIMLQDKTKTDNKPLNLKCECGSAFCLNCKGDGHRPLDCDKYKEWTGLIFDKDGKLNTLWMMKNAKQCPKCHVPIDKNGGCMHMTCKNCKYEFCWICLGDWKQHGTGNWKCNKFTPSEGQNLSKDKIRLEKLGFYRDRFESHYTSIPKAENKRKVVLRNMTDIIVFAREQNITMNHLSFAFDDKNLKDALDLLVEARRAITMTYAFGYFWEFHRKQQDMFEYQQSLLWELLEEFDKETDAYEQQPVLFDNLFDKLGDNKCIIATKFINFTTNLSNKVKGLTKACNHILKFI
jgi:ariadne-1